MAGLTQMPGHHIFSNACSRYVDRPRRSSGPLEGQSPVAQVGMLTGLVSFAQQGRRTSVSLACLRLQWRAGRQYSCSPEPTIACFLVKLSPCYADSLFAQLRLCLGPCGCRHIHIMPLGPGRLHPNKLVPSARKSGACSLRGSRGRLTPCKLRSSTSMWLRFDAKK